MKYTYLLSSKILDRLFGFKLQCALSLTDTPRDGVERMINTEFYEDKHDLVIGDVFVIDTIKSKGMAGIVNLEKELTSDDVNPRNNPDIRIEGNFLDELDEYLDNDIVQYDKIVVVNTDVSQHLATYLKKKILPHFLRVAVY